MSLPSEIMKESKTRCGGVCGWQLLSFQPPCGVFLLLRAYRIRELFSRFRRPIFPPPSTKGSLRFRKESGLCILYCGRMFPTLFTIARAHYFVIDSYTSCFTFFGLFTKRGWNVFFSEFSVFCSVICLPAVAAVHKTFLR